MRSLLVSLLHLVFSSRNQHYELILMGSIDIISGMTSKTLFNLGKYSFGHNNKHVFSQSSDIAKTFVLLCSKCYVVTPRYHATVIRIIVDHYCSKIFCVDQFGSIQFPNALFILLKAIWPWTLIIKNRNKVQAL